MSPTAPAPKVPAPPVIVGQTNGPARIASAAIGLEAIETAAQRLEGQIVKTPCLRARTLSELAGAELWLKFENLQFTASFKERGAYNKLVQLSAAERARGVIAMSAGNHAQGVAYHAQRLGIATTIVMPKATPFIKEQNTRRLGARVLLHGSSLEEAARFARELVETEGLIFIHPYDDEAIIAGQGTVALEMLSAARFDSLVVPIGGGGLISGMAVATAALSPQTEIVGVEAALYPSMLRAIEGQEPPQGCPTIAEGIAVKAPGRLTLEIIRRRVAAILLAAEADIEAAILTLLEVEKTVVEGAGAAGLAAVLSHKERFRGRRVGIVLSGGNIDMRLLSGVILRGLVRSERLVRLRVGVPDSPGSLADLTASIARSGGNVIDVVHQRSFSRLGIKEADLDMTIETRDAAHAAAMVSALEAAGFNVDRLHI